MIQKKKIFEDKKENEIIIKSFDNNLTLSKDFFENDIFKPEIKNRLLLITDKFMDFLGVEFFIHDIILTGSIVNYNYSKYSDVDLHVLIDFEDTKHDIKLLSEFFKSKKEVWNKEHNITIKNYDVEMYVQDINEKHVSSGVYSLLNDKWIIKPKKINPQIDDKKIIKKSEEFEIKIDSISKEKNIDVEELKKLFNKIKKLRKSGLEKNGEYSYENLTFKLLKRNGYIKKLITLLNNQIDKNLTIKEQLPYF
jgi:hypothetical protein